MLQSPGGGCSGGRSPLEHPSRAEERRSCTRTWLDLLSLARLDAPSVGSPGTVAALGMLLAHSLLSQQAGCRDWRLT